MKIKDSLGLTARCLYFIMGVVLSVATVASTFEQWPAISAGKTSPMGLAVLMLIIIPLALFIMVWAVVGRHREWRIEDNRIRVRLLSLTSWKRDYLIYPEQVESIDRQQYSDDSHTRVAHTITITLRDGSTFASPKILDGFQADQAWRKVEALCQRGQFSA